MFSQEEVSQLSVPTLCVWGKEDGILPKTGESFLGDCLIRTLDSVHQPILVTARI